MTPDLSTLRQAATAAKEASEQRLTTDNHRDWQKLTEASDAAEARLLDAITDEYDSLHAFVLSLLDAYEDAKLLDHVLTFQSHDLPLTMTAREWLRSLTPTESRHER
jgi:hypothetical protein